MGDKYKVKKPPAPSPIPKKTSSPKLSFSFAFLSDREKFNCRLGGEHYTQKLLERLKAVSGNTKEDLFANHSPALRAHPIVFADTTEPNGFPLNPYYQDMPAFQFSVSVNEHGRVCGIIMDNVFFVVWLDPKHNLYR